MPSYITTEDSRLLLTEAAPSLFVVTQEYTADLADVIFAVRRLDPTTGAVLATWKNSDPGAPLSDGDTIYQLYGCAVYNGALYVMAKGSNNDSMNTHSISMGPGATILHDSASGFMDYTWALLKFTNPSLASPEEIVIWHPDGNYAAVSASRIPSSGSTYDAVHSIFEVFGGIVYTQTMKAPQDSTGCDTDYLRFANSGYQLSTGARMSQDDQGPLGGPFGVARNARSWCIGPDGTFYTVGTGTDFNPPGNSPTIGSVWAGTRSDPFQTLVYDAGGTAGPSGSDSANRYDIDWLCCNPDSGDLFLMYYGGDTGSPQLIDRVSSAGALLDTYVLSTTAFTTYWSESTGFCPGMVAQGDFLYCSTDLADAGPFHTKTIEGGVWKIKISDGTGQGDPAFYCGSPYGGEGVIDTDANPLQEFGEGLIYGMALGAIGAGRPLITET